MANPVTIYIHHQSYRFLAEEEETYLQQCADIVNKEMTRPWRATPSPSPTVRCWRP